MRIHCSRNSAFRLMFTLALVADDIPIKPEDFRDDYRDRLKKPAQLNPPGRRQASRELSAASSQPTLAFTRTLQSAYLKGDLVPFLLGYLTMISLRESSAVCFALLCLLVSGAVLSSSLQLGWPMKM
eukprot:s2327_g1.t3